ncbi:hypothetical protein [Nitrobacter sp. TKz-YC02]|uniref:hypothetical protein n=1 Tax=Nitrobacter sp. TKz-YC02 TaxID=3398704 RepID=UPI003CF4660F
MATIQQRNDSPPGEIATHDSRTYFGTERTDIRLRYVELASNFGPIKSHRQQHSDFVT